jgi:hypothetical protein
MGSRAVIGESRPFLSSSPALSNPQFGGSLQELAACDSREAHDRIAHPSLDWSRSFGAAGEYSSFVCPSDLLAAAASDFACWTPTSTPLDNLNSLRYRSEDMSSNMLHSMSPTTPGFHGLPHPFASPTSTHTRGFKRSASSDDEENGDGDTRPSSSSRRNTAVKRACNECRQQKVSNCPVNSGIEASVSAKKLVLSFACAPPCSIAINAYHSHEDLQHE